MDSEYGRLFDLSGRILRYASIVPTVAIPHHIDRQHTHPLIGSADRDSSFGCDSPSVELPVDVDGEITLVHRARRCYHIIGKDRIGTKVEREDLRKDCL